MDGDGVAHHASGYGVGESGVDGAHSPGVAKIVGREGNAVAFELERDLLADELESGLGEVGVEVGQIYFAQVEGVYPVGVKGPNVMCAGFGRLKHFDSGFWIAAGEHGIVAEENFVIAQAVGSHDAVDEAPSLVGDKSVGFEDGLVSGERAGLGFAVAVAAREGFERRG